MAIIEIQTLDGPQKVRVCDYCRTVCIPSGSYCSGRCARLDAERLKWEVAEKAKTRKDA